MVSATASHVTGCAFFAFSAQGLNMKSRLYASQTFYDFVNNARISTRVMLHPSQMTFLCRQRPLLEGLRGSTRFLPSLAATRPVHISKKHSSSTCKKQAQTAQDENLPAHKLSPIQREFWTSRSTWRRAGINTLQCLIGCSIGDFSALWMLQTYSPDLGMGTIMAVSSMYIHFALSLLTYLE